MLTVAEMEAHPLYDEWCRLAMLRATFMCFSAWVIKQSAPYPAWLVLREQHEAAPGIPE